MSEDVRVYMTSGREGVSILTLVDLSIASFAFTSFEVGILSVFHLRRFHKAIGKKEHRRVGEEARTDKLSFLFFFFFDCVKAVL